MAEEAQRILDSIANKPHLNLYQKEEGDEVSAKVLVHYSKKRCKKQNILCNQLQVLRFLLEFLQEASTVGGEESNPELLNKEREMVRQKWKGLKSEYLNKVKEVEELLPQLLEKVQLLQEKKNQLEASLQMYQDKAKQELGEVLQKQKQVVQKCQDHIQQLKVEIEKLEQSAESWIQTVNKDSSLLELLRTLQGMSLVSVEDKEMVLDLYAGETAVAPLRINVHFTSEEQFHIKTEDSMPGLPPELQHGATSRITSVIPELQCWYRSHGQLLAEMRALQDRFSIDWLPVERQVLLLKDDKRYTLYVEPGYPQNGGVKLISVKELETDASSSHLKPPDEHPSLTTWLEYLQTLHQLGR